jgi:hypothetical protein
MSKLVVITSEMHKVAELPICVQCEKPENRSEKVSVEFEVFHEGESFKVVPLTTKEMKKMANLPDEFSFQYKDGRICAFEPCHAELVDHIADRLCESRIIEREQDRMS